MGAVELGWFKIRHLTYGKTFELRLMSGLNHAMRTTQIATAFGLQVCGSIAIWKNQQTWVKHMKNLNLTKNLTPLIRLALRDAARLAAMIIACLRISSASRFQASS